MKHLAPAGGDPAGGTLYLFDISPIELAGFQLRARSVTPVGAPTLKQWVAAMQFANAAQESSPYWVGDLLNYAETRKEWSERLDQAIAITGLARHTAINMAYVAKHVAEPERELAPTLSHAAEVAPLPREQQRTYLTLARDGNMTRRELRLTIKADKRPLVLEGQALLEGKYRVIYADPPWLYDRAAGFSATRPHYRGMPVEDICKLPIEAHAQPNAVLFLWVTSPMLPLAFPVIDGWGFEYKTSIVWDKVLSAGGHYVAVKHELLLIATRGSCTPDAPVPSPDSVQVIRRPGEHSEKPEEFRQLITQLYTRGPYLELFARKQVKGWTTFGNDARLWANDAAAAAS